jgi:hypothetical protein
MVFNGPFFPGRVTSRSDSRRSGTGRLAGSESDHPSHRQDHDPDPQPEPEAAIMISKVLAAAVTGTQAAGNSELERSKTQPASQAGIPGPTSSMYRVQVRTGMYRYVP